jgi:hypothetical protein
MARIAIHADPRLIHLPRDQGTSAMALSTSGQTIEAIPEVDLALITGSANWGLRFPEDVALPGVSVLARDVAYETQYGVSENWKFLEFDGSLLQAGRSNASFMPMISILSDAMISGNVFSISLLRCRMQPSRSQIPPQAISVASSLLACIDRERRPSALIQ